MRDINPGHRVVSPKFDDLSLGAFGQGAAQAQAGHGTFVAPRVDHLDAANLFLNPNLFLNHRGGPDMVERIRRLTALASKSVETRSACRGIWA